MTIHVIICNWRIVGELFLVPNMSDLENNVINWTYTNATSFTVSSCAKDSSLTCQYLSHSRVQRFDLRAFKFVQRYPLMHIECDVLVCSRNESRSRCTRGCQKTPRDRRSLKRSGNGEPRIYYLSTGPFTSHNSENHSEGTSREYIN